MKNTDELLAKSLTAEDTEIIPHLPYLLQDIWELGSSPCDIVELIEKHIDRVYSLRILDLACGKGAVSLSLAKALNSIVKGIDIMSEFIAVATKKAQDSHVKEMCEFVVEDINKSIAKERGYDIVIFGAAGDILGSPLETLKKLSNTVVDKGYIILDDAISIDGKICPCKSEWDNIFKGAKLNVIGQKFVNETQLIAINRTNQDYIIQRAEELKAKYPDKAMLFKKYVDNQQEECDMLEADLIACTWLLQKQ